MTPIKHIEEELADCRAAFAAHPEATRAWCCHHDAISEWFSEPFENRIKYILSDKPECERAIRFRNFRPVINTAAIAETRKVFDTARNETRKVFDTARNEASKVYGAAIAEAWKVFTAAIAEARKVYDAAIDEAWEARAAAIAEARKVRDAAIDEAYKVYDAALLSLLNQEWPDNTWKDGSIFTKCGAELI